MGGKHTFGEWKENPTETAYHDIGVIEEGGKGAFTFYRVCRVEMNNPDRDANAKLISAAPDLLKAIKELYEVTKNCKIGLAKTPLHTAFNKTFRHVEQAIKKATE